MLKWLSGGCGFYGDALEGWVRAWEDCGVGEEIA